MPSVIDNAATDSLTETHEWASPTLEAEEIARLRKKIKNMRRELRRMNREAAHMRLTILGMHNQSPLAVARAVAEHIRDLVK